MLQFPEKPSSAAAKRLRYRCPACAEKHEGFPAMACELPDAIAALDEHEAAGRAVKSSDLCILDNKRYFIRCTLHVAVHEYEEGFEFGPWVEVAQRDFSAYAVNCAYGSPPGWMTIHGKLANGFPGYEPGTLGLKCKIHMPQEEGLRPFVEMANAGHPMGIEQTEGMSIKRAFELVSHMKGFLMLMD